MKRIRKTKKVIICTIILTILLAGSIFAHSGRTDRNGGHYDHSTGEYHYHHGYSAHQHINGLCPYKDKIPEETSSETPKDTQELEAKIKDLEAQIDKQENKLREVNNQCNEAGINFVNEISNNIARRNTCIYILGAFSIIMVILYFKLKISLIDNKKK